MHLNGSFLQSSQTRLRVQFSSFKWPDVDHPQRDLQHKVKTFISGECYTIFENVNTFRDREEIPLKAEHYAHTRNSRNKHVREIMKWFIA